MGQMFKSNGPTASPMVEVTTSATGVAEGSMGWQYRKRDLTGSICGEKLNFRVVEVVDWEEVEPGLTLSSIMDSSVLEGETGG